LIESQQKFYSYALERIKFKFKSMLILLERKVAKFRLFACT